MNIVVCVKQTFDSEAKIQLNQEGLIDESLVKLIINPFDEYAVEEALRLTEAYGGRVTLVSVNPIEPAQALRQGLAMGADSAVWLDCSGIDCADQHIHAELVGTWLKSQEFDLVLCGKEAIDDGAAEFPSRLGEVLDLPQGNTVSGLKMENGKAMVRRDIEGGYEIIELNLPCLLSVQKGLNEPRYPSMRRVMEAKRKKIDRIVPEDLGLSCEKLTPFVRVEAYMLPPPRRAGKILEGTCEQTVADLIRSLRDERTMGQEER